MRHESLGGFGHTARSLAGSLLFIVGGGILMAIITAEALYPAPYSTAKGDISDLGGSRPPHSVILQPSATIFDFTMVVSGVLVIVAAYFVYRAFRRRASTIVIGLLITFHQGSTATMDTMAETIRTGRHHSCPVHRP
jgi:hypothetical membrane protein